MVKTKSKWTSEEDKLATSNWMALYPIWCGFQTFSLIETSKLTKEAWETLQVIHEGSKEGEDHFSEPVALIIDLKNTVT